MKKKKYNPIDDPMIEIRGILRTLADQQGQSIATKKRLYELIEVLKRKGRLPR